MASSIAKFPNLICGGKGKFVSDLAIMFPEIRGVHSQQNNHITCFLCSSNHSLRSLGGVGIGESRKLNLG